MFFIVCIRISVSFRYTLILKTLFKRNMTFWNAFEINDICFYGCCLRPVSVYFDQTIMSSLSVTVFKIQTFIQRQWSLNRMSSYCVTPVVIAIVLCYCNRTWGLSHTWEQSIHKLFFDRMVFYIKYKTKSYSFDIKVNICALTSYSCIFVHCYY